jgi:hypothetical protein
MFRFFSKLATSPKSGATFVTILATAKFFVARTWSANIKTVFIVKRLEQKLKRSSSDGPRRSMTRTL